jgi:hypothetical protein
VAPDTIFPVDSPGISSSLGYSAQSSSVAALVLPVERPHTCLQSGVTKPKKFTDTTIRYAYFAPLVNLLVLLKHFQIFVGRRLWMKSIMLL